MRTGKSKIKHWPSSRQRNKWNTFIRAPYQSIRRKFIAIRGLSTKVKLTTEYNSLVCKPHIPYILSNTNLRKVHPVVKKYLQKNNHSSTISRSIKTFPEFLEKVNKGSITFICSTCLQNTFLHNTTLEKMPGNIRTSLVQKNLVDTEISGMLTKRRWQTEPSQWLRQIRKKGCLSN